MSLTCGLIGLPNVGKSTLFNALTRSSAAEAANYPFCTIDPQAGQVLVRDARLHKVAALADSERLIPATVGLTDIAGLVQGASKGEGLGNQFLHHIRETDALLHVLRCFEDPSVLNTRPKIDPIADLEIVQTELLLADLASMERQSVSLERQALSAPKADKKNASERHEIAQKILAGLTEGQTASQACRSLRAEAQELAKSFHLLTSKPVVYVCNLPESALPAGNAYSDAVAQRAAQEGNAVLLIAASMEAELAQFDAGTEQAFLKSYGLDTAGLDRLTKTGMELLDLIVFFTAGKKETRAWPLRRGATALAAAATIHGDFARGFICAQTIDYHDYIQYNGQRGASEAGRMRAEGRDYVLRDADVVLFRFNV